MMPPSRLNSFSWRQWPFPEIGTSRVEPRGLRRTRGIAFAIPPPPPMKGRTLASKPRQRSYRDNINDAVLEAMARGVKPRLVVDIDEENVALMARVARRVPLRHVDWQRGGFIIFDVVSILVFLVQDERTLGRPAETALWTNSEDYVKAHVEIFEQGWASGIPAKERIAGLGAS